MLRLLRADGQALRNMLRSPAARRALLASLAGYAGFAIVGVVTFGRIAGSMPIRQALREQAALAPPLLSLLILVPMILAMGLGLIEAGRLLFVESRTTLVLLAPVPRRWVVLHAWVRGLLFALPVYLLLTLPALLNLIGRARVGAGALPMFLLVSTLVMAPAVALTSLVPVLARRLAAGPRARVVLNVAQVLLGIVLTVLASTLLLGGREQSRVLASSLPELGALPSWFLDPGHLVAWAGGVVPGDAWALVRLGLWLAATAPLLWLAARIHPAAFERSLVATLGRPRTVTPRRRWWPQAVAASVTRKDLVCVLRARANVGMFALLGAGAVATLARGGLKLSVHHPGAPPMVDEVLHLLGTAVLFVLLLGSLQGGAVLLDEGRSLDLFSASPAPRQTLLRGKVPGLLLPCLWVVLTLGIAAAPVIGASFTGILLFVLAVTPVLLATWSVTLWFGTLPVFRGMVTGEPGGQSLRFILGSLVGSMPGIGALVWIGLLTRAVGRGAAASRPFASETLLWHLGAAWIAALLLAVLGWRLAVAQLTRMLGPQR